MAREDDEAMKRFRAQQKRQADDQRQANLDAAAAAEEKNLARYNAAEDKEFEDGMRQIFGAEIEDIQKYVSRASDADVSRIMRDINAAGAKGNTGKAKRIARKNKTKIKAAAKKGKDKGCAVLALIGLGITATVAYGAVQGVSAVAGALW